MLLIEPLSPRENGHIESFNGKSGDEFPNLEVVHAGLAAKRLALREIFVSAAAQHSKKRPRSTSLPAF